MTHTATETNMLLQYWYYNINTDADTGICTGIVPILTQIPSILPHNIPGTDTDTRLRFLQILIPGWWLHWYKYWYFVSGERYVRAIAMLWSVSTPASVLALALLPCYFLLHSSHFHSFCICLFLCTMSIRRKKTRVLLSPVCLRFCVKKFMNIICFIKRSFQPVLIVLCIIEVSFSHSLLSYFFQ